jgi:hypothetical protein
MIMKKIVLVKIMLLTALCLSFQVQAQNTINWVRTVSGSQADAGRAVTSDDEGNVYSIGFAANKVYYKAGEDRLDSFSANTTNMRALYITKSDSLGNLEWSRIVGATNASNGNTGYAIKVRDGHVYATGFFTRNPEFDPGNAASKITSRGGTGILEGLQPDVFVLKLTTDGTFVWVRQLGGAGWDVAHGLDVDDAGNVYTTGIFSSTAIFDPQPSGPDTLKLVSAGGVDIFVSKITASGQLAWAKRIGGTGADTAYGLCLDPSGNIHVAGTFTGKVDFNPSTADADTFFLTSNATDAFVLKLNQHGEFIWAKSMGGSGRDVAMAVAVDIQGNVIATGGFTGKADFNPSTADADTFYLNSAGDVDIFISKLSPAGNFIWAGRMGGTSEDVGNSIALDLSGNIYTTGAFRLTADMDPGPLTKNIISKSINAGSPDIFISKLSPQGAYIWAHAMGGTINDIGYGIAVGTLEREVYVTGSFQDTVRFNTGGLDSIKASSQVSTAVDAFLMKFSQPSCKSYSTVSVATCDSFIFDGITRKSSGTYTAIFTNGAGCDSTVVLTLNIQNTSSVMSHTACGSYTLNGQTYLASGVYTQKHTNAAGCDSILTLTLTINQPSDSLITATACDSFTLNGQTYRATGVYTQTYTNAVNCDSVVTLDLTIDSSTSRILTETVCDSFALNGQTYLTSGVYVQHLTNAAGCDSTLTLNLTVHETPDATVIKSGVTLTSGNAAAYQWADCDGGYAAIPGATQQTFTPASSGHYAVIAYGNGGCADTSDCVEVIRNTDGVVGILGAAAFRLYPNPTRSFVVVESDRELTGGKVRISTVIGKILVDGSMFTGKRFVADLSAYPAGIYILEITDERGATAKFRLIRE